jgi:hypothetical protein
MSKEQDQIAQAQLAALLDKNLSDVADLPEYLDYAPTGYYHLKMAKLEQKMVEIKDKDNGGVKVPAPVIQFTFEVMAVLELEKAGEEPPKVGSRIGESVFFHKDPEKAMEVIKAKFAGLAESQGWNTVADIIAGIEGLEFGAVVKSKEDKEKKDKFYIQVSNAKPL